MLDLCNGKGDTIRRDFSNNTVETASREAFGQPDWTFGMSTLLLSQLLLKVECRSWFTAETVIDAAGTCAPLSLKHKPLEIEQLASFTSCRACGQMLNRLILDTQRKANHANPEGVSTSNISPRNSYPKEYMVAKSISQIFRFVKHPKISRTSLLTSRRVYSRTGVHEGQTAIYPRCISEGNRSQPNSRTALKESDIRWFYGRRTKWESSSIFLSFMLIGTCQVPLRQLGLLDSLNFPGKRPLKPLLIKAGRLFSGTKNDDGNLYHSFPKHIIEELSAVPSTCIGAEYALSCADNRASDSKTWTTMTACSKMTGRDPYPEIPESCMSFFRTFLKESRAYAAL